ncbi:LmbE family N-acetylglucosaminyl deacetylase [Brassicibacter mesophilus]
MVKTIVGVFAHPDDEISVVGLLGRAALILTEGKIAYM